MLMLIENYIYNAHSKMQINYKCENSKCKWNANPISSLECIYNLQ